VGVVVTVVAGEIIKMKDIGNEFLMFNATSSPVVNYACLRFLLAEKAPRKSSRLHELRENSLALGKHNRVTHDDR